ncbi:hypothetical protein BGW38_000015 [Lunasporangiospora selenospora]|uniref:histidine--tRNA ligase n=1 Tax=Lunasporangiospora selenospora TaxID=979761 RepID=A0A9P6KII5_9FUNG|nr:hypothetical protein BGW38_000015 [Lunasporangiospora selenospora]
MKDRFGAENRRFQYITETGTRLATLYGLEQVTAPILEYSQVFERTLGDDSDVVGKELYSFEDKGGSKLTMRPEGTAGITRALISQKMYADLPQKYFYYGPMFRHERPQKGRLRQFEQFGIETNPLRILDSKSPQDIAVLEGSPLLSNYLSNDSQKRFAFITETLSQLGIPFEINPRLVRGLDYYQETVFEFKSSSPLLGVQQGTVLAGGRYDGLVEKMGGPHGIASVGWAAGLERLSLLLDDTNVPATPRPIVVIPVPDRPPASTDIPATSVFVSDGAALHSHAMNVTKALRNMGLKTEFLHLTNSTSTKSQLPKQLTKANKLNASHAIILGADEMSKDLVTFKNLDSSKQKQCRIEDVIMELAKPQ